MAGAPVTDWKHYDTIYTERYMGTPEGNPKGYESSSPLQKAGALEADLLLIHGASDDNVHLANTLAFVTSPDLVVALSLAGTLAFDPRTDALTDAAGQPVTLDAPVRAGKPYALQVHPRQLHGFRAKEDKIARDRALVSHFERTLKPGS